MSERQPDSTQPMTGALPVQPTPFVGRRQELETVASLLASSDCRLLTLVGPGGIGKTRLSLELAASLREEHPDGVYFVELDAVADAALVARAVASAVGVRDQPERSALETLSAALRQKRLLLLLDNCEHLLEASAELAYRLLTACPDLTILTTSREPLHTAGEVIWEVPPLSMPEPEGPRNPDELREVDAVALFVDRARRALPSFALTSENTPTIARLCHRLDGLPLALELAAARVRMLSVEQILERLDGSLRLLAGGDRLAPARQQTLRATLDWSYDLLGPDQQRLFQRLSVFAGTFCLEAVEAVCAGEGLAPARILDLLSSLVDRSLVAAGHRGGREHRFRLLDTMQAYAAERLAATGSMEGWLARHLHWYAELAVAAEPESWFTDEVERLERLDLERDNLRAALRWALESSQAEDGHRLAAALAWYWFRRGHLQEGRHWLDPILALPGEVTMPARVGALHGAGSVAVMQGDLKGASPFLEEAVARGCDPTCSRTALWSLHRLAMVASLEGDYAQAEAHLARCSRAFQELGDQEGVATVQRDQGWVALYLGDDRRSEALLQAGLLAFRERGDLLGCACALRGLARVARVRQELAEATTLLQEALRLAHGHWRLEVQWCLEDLAGVAVARNLPERAARLFGAAEALLERSDYGLPTIVKSDRESDLRAAREQLGDRAFKAAFAVGRERSLERAVAFALEASDEPGAGVEAVKLTPLQAEKAKYGGLTARERQVAALVARGMSNRAIAEELVVTLRTAEAHVTHILAKLSFNSRAQIAAWAVDRGLAQAPETLAEQMRGSTDG